MKDRNCDKAQYTCAICKESYNTIQERAKCEMACIKKIEEEEKKAAAAKAKAEKDTRQQEVSAALDNALTLVNKFIEDYGSYQYSGRMKDLDMANMDFFPIKLWHHFWF